MIVVGSALFSTFSLIIACIVKTRDRFMGIGQVLTMPIFFASNAIYPIAIMPGWLRAISSANPLTYEVDALRALMLTGSTSEYGLMTDFAILAAFTAVFTARRRAHVPAPDHLSERRRRDNDFVAPSSRLLYIATHKSERRRGSRLSIDGSIDEGRSLRHGLSGFSNSCGGSVAPLRAPSAQRWRRSESMNELISHPQRRHFVGEIRRLRPRSGGPGGAGLGPDRRAGRHGDLPSRDGVGSQERNTRSTKATAASIIASRWQAIIKLADAGRTWLATSPPSATASSMAVPISPSRSRIDAAVLAEAAPIHPARAAASAAQSGRRRGGAGRVPDGDAGRLLRHGVSPQPPVRRRHVRAAALVLRGGRAALRLSRPLLRIHRAAAAHGRAGRSPQGA